MTAVDTNVVVRLLMADDPNQAATAKSLFASGEIWIAKTVLLETTWVLRKLYGLEVSAIREAFVKLLRLENVHTEDKESTSAALALTTHGLDLPDAIHFTSKPKDCVFVTFDRSFIRRAQRAGATGIAHPRDRFKQSTECVR